MQYMGSKARFAKELLPIILKERRPGQWYVEPFVGGANMIDKVDGNRLGADLNPYVICLLKAVAEGWQAPENISEEDYKNAKNNQTLTPHTAFIGFLCSFGSKWFGGYARATDGKNYAAIGHRSLNKQAHNLKDISFHCSSYADLDIPKNSIIYCDPPYEGTTKYATGGFDHKTFWQWCREKSIEGHQVFVSEYNAPADFECVWSKEIDNKINFGTGSKQGVEKLFVYNPSKEA